MEEVKRISKENVRKRRKEIVKMGDEKTMRKRMKKKKKDGQGRVISESRNKEMTGTGKRG